MKKHKRRALYVLLVLGSALLLAGAWNLPDDAGGAIHSDRESLGSE